VVVTARGGEFDPRDVGPAIRPTAETREALLNAYFDGEMDEASRRSYVDSLAVDAGAAHEFAATAYVVEALRRGVDAPDLASRVLAETDRRALRGAWLNGRTRTVVRVGRLAAAACLLVALGGALVARRQAPAAFDLAARPAPLTAVVVGGRAGAQQAVRNVAGAFETALAAARRVGELTTAAASAGHAVHPAGGEAVYVAWAPQRMNLGSSRVVWLCPAAGEMAHREDEMRSRAGSARGR
jgi:hypothetical protein